MWSNLLTWTAMMDPTQKLYLGSQAVVGDQVFGHGGSGYILSHAAMAELAALYSSDQEYFDQKAADHWAGDAVLAEALEHELNITLTWSFPVMQGGDPDVQEFSEYGYDRQLWCYPVVSYHHMKPSTIGSLGYLKQDWMAMNHSEPLKHKDVFRTWVLPQMNHTMGDWDNLADEEVEDNAGDEWDCRAVCEDKTVYSIRIGIGAVRYQAFRRLGSEKDDRSRSGWMMGRIHRLMKRLDECSDGNWILP